MMPSLASGASAVLTVHVAPSGVPVEAANAGFTTLAGNYDFSSPAYADPNTNWLDCGDNNNTQIWHTASPGIGSINCNIHQKVDTLDGSTVMSTVLDATAVASACSGFSSGDHRCSVSMMTQNDSSRVVTAGFPHHYMETVTRIEHTYSDTDDIPSGSVWEWWYPGATCGTELDNVELSSDKGGFGNDGSPDYCDSGNNITAWTSYAPNNTKIPSGWSPTAYHKYGMLDTSDGASTIYLCWFIDDVLQGCNNQGSNSGLQSQQYVARHFLVTTVYAAGDGVPFAGPRVQDTKYIRVWTCPTWTSTDSSPTGMCNGSTLFNSGGLTYWH